MSAERERRIAGQADPTLAAATAGAEAALAQYRSLCSATGGWAVAGVTPSEVTLRFEHPQALAPSTATTVPHFSEVTIDRTSRLVKSAVYSAACAEVGVQAARKPQPLADFGAAAFYTAAASCITTGLATTAATASSAQRQPLQLAAREFRAAAEVCEGVRLARSAAGGVGVRIVEQPVTGSWAVALDLSHGLVSLSCSTAVCPPVGLKLRILLTLPIAKAATAEPWSAQVCAREWE